MFLILLNFLLNVLHDKLLSIKIIYKHSNIIMTLDSKKIISMSKRLFIINNLVYTYNINIKIITFIA